MALTPQQKQQIRIQIADLRQKQISIESKIDAEKSKASPNQQKIQALATRSRQISDAIRQREAILESSPMRRNEGLGAIGAGAVLGMDKVFARGIPDEVMKALSPATDFLNQIRSAGRKDMGLPGLTDLLKTPSQIKKLIEPIDKLFVSLRRGTIGAGDLSKRLIELRKDTLAIGVSNEDLRKTYDALFKANLSFTEYLDKKAADSLVKYVSILEKFGVAGTLTGDISNTLSKQLGFGATKTENFLKKLAGTAKSLGLSLPKAFQDFKQSSDRFVLTGIDQMSSRFAKLQALTKATGISTGDMINTFGKATDTFSGSVKVSARLNAMLGTNISAMTLLRNNAEENVSLISKALRSSGKTFDQLGKFEKLMLMQATGIKSASQLKSLMEMSPVELELKQLRGQMSKTAGLEDDLRKRATTRQDLEKGIGEVILTKRYKQISDNLKDSFIVMMNQVAKGQKVGLAAFNYQISIARRAQQQALLTQAKLINETLPANLSNGISTALKPLTDALKEATKAIEKALKIRPRNNFGTPP